MSLGDGTSVPTYRADAGGRIVDINQALIEFLGYPHAGLLTGGTLSDVYPDPNLHQQLQDQARRADAVISVEHELIHFSGRSLWVKHLIRALREGDGEVVGFEGMVIDVTARKRATERLEYREERYRSLFESSPIALWEEDFSAMETWLDNLRQRGVADLRSYLNQHPEELARGIGLIRIVDANQAAIDLVEASSREELLGRMPEILVTPSGLDAFTEQMVALWEKRRRLSINIHGQTFTGRPLWCRLEWVIPPGNGLLDTSRVVVAITDLTDYETARQDLERIAESRDRFISSASHHLRTPLTVGMGFSSELTARWDEIDEDQRRTFVALISTHIAKIAEMIDNLLVAARSDIGTVSIRAESLALSEQVATVIEELGDRSVRFVSQPVTAWADPARVRHILRNLLTNALQHGDPPIEVFLNRSGEVASITVRDRGSGVPEQQLERLFTRYHSGHHDPGQPGPLGIGLSVARTLARLMQGDISYVRSQEGTEFILTLPVRPRI